MVGAGVAHFPVHFRCVLFVLFCFVMFLRVAHFPVGNKWVGGPCGSWEAIRRLEYSRMLPLGWWWLLVYPLEAPSVPRPVRSCASTPPLNSALRDGSMPLRVDDAAVGAVRRCLGVAVMAPSRRPGGKRLGLVDIEQFRIVLLRQREWPDRARGCAPG